MAGQIIAFVNQKGGVGKTTTAVSVCAALGHAGQGVLLVDLDPPGQRDERGWRRGDHGALDL